MYDKEKQDRLRRLWKLYRKHCDQALRRFCKAKGFDVEEVSNNSWLYVQDGLRFPPFPRVLNELTCGAKTRKGTPCKNKGLYRSGRCKFHGGLSTGPKTAEGKKRCAENGKKRQKEAEPMNG